VAIVRYTLDVNNPLPLDAAALARLARLDLLTEEQIEAAALSDPDNPPMTEDELERLGAAAAVRDARRSANLSQPQFAETFHFSLGRLRDLEQGRTKPDSAILAYLKLIARDPEGVRQALGAVV
jgi:putative transcriptional regulator